MITMFDGIWRSVENNGVTLAMSSNKWALNDGNAGTYTIVDKNNLTLSSERKGVGSATLCGNVLTVTLSGIPCQFRK